jgi:hypothetical protein
MSIPELDTEIKYFEEQREEFLKHALGKYALIKGTECVGFFDTVDNAYEEGARRFEGEPFLIQPVLPEDPINEIPAFCAGLLYADI